MWVVVQNRQGAGGCLRWQTLVVAKHSGLPLITVACNIRNSKGPKTPLALNHSICIIEIFNKMTLVLFIFLVMQIWKSRPGKYRIVHMVWSHCYREYRRKTKQEQAVSLWWEARVPHVPPSPHISCTCVPGTAAMGFVTGCGPGQPVLLTFPLWLCFSSNGCDPLGRYNSENWPTLGEKYNRKHCSVPSTVLVNFFFLFHFYIWVDGYVRVAKWRYYNGSRLQRKVRKLLLSHAFSLGDAISCFNVTIQRLGIGSCL